MVTPRNSLESRESCSGWVEDEKQTWQMTEYRIQISGKSS